MNTEERNSGHLTAQEISRWLVEGPEQSTSQHVQNCWTCQAKLTDAQAPLTAFRTALVEWSESQTVRPLDHSPVARNESLWGLRLWLPVASFALAALLMIGHAKFPALLHGNSSGPSSLATAPATATDADEALLAQVDTEVSEAVPDAMAPLTDLVAWDSSEGPAPQTTTPEKHAASKTSAKPAIAKAPVDVAN